MKKITVPAKRFISITPNELLNKINAKSQIKLGCKVLKAIGTTVHNRVSVYFENNKVENYANFSQVTQHFNVVYNLKLEKHEAISYTPDKEIGDNSNIEIATKTLIEFIQSFQSTTENIDFNKMTLTDYFESYEWKGYEFNKDELKYILEHLYKSKDSLSERYLKMVEKMIYRT